MSVSVAPLPNASALMARLSRLAPLQPGEIEQIRSAERNQRRLPAGRELLGEGEPILEKRAILKGWACRQRFFPDGRRQILGFILPGDLIGVCRQNNPIASTTILAVTELITCPLPTAIAESTLAEAYAQSGALDEAYLLAQIVRLGRMTAAERLADLLLETRTRLMLAGFSAADDFPLPVTQIMLADMLGLTSVHMNRMLQAMRRSKLLAFRKGTISLLDRGSLERAVDYKAARVTGNSGVWGAR